MNRNLLGLLVLSAFLPVFSAEAFLLPPFKLDASTIGNEIVSYGNTSSQTAGKGLQQAAIVQTAITYGQGAKEAYEFATKMLNDFKNVNLNNLGETLDKMSEAEAEQTRVKEDAAVEITAKAREANAKISELDANTRELNKKIVEDPENIKKYQKQIEKNEKEKKNLAAIAMCYDNVYVAQVALGADYNQTLKALVEGGYSVVGVVTQPDRPKGRGKKLAMSPVKEYAIQQGIPVLQPERISRDGYEDLLNLHPDLCVTAAFGQILSQKILDIPPLGTINVHASLLPKHRGSAPIAWAMVQGDKTTGVTTMMTARGIDNGDMLLKAETPIDPAETCGELTARLSEIGAKLLIETLKALENGTLERIPQDESQMTYDPKLEKDMGVIDWTQDAADIVHRIHGLNPWPGCTSAAPGGTWKLLRAEVADMSGQPGEVLAADGKEGLIVAAGKNAVRVRQLQVPGGKPMDARDYLRGHAMAAGTMLKEDTENE